LIRRGDKLEPATWEEALSLIATQMQSAKSGGKIAAFGGNSLTVEENFLLQSLFREGLKCNNIDHRIGMSSPSMAQEAIPPGMSMSIGDCEQLSYAILIGLDLTEEFPVIWLRLKQAILRGAVVIFLGHFAPEIASQLHKTRLHAPGKELEEIQTLISEVQELAKSGNKGALFVGRQYLNSPNRRNILTELHKLTQAVPNLSLNVMEGEKNSMGARLAGVHPEWEPLGAKLEKTGMNALAVLEESANKGWEFLYAVGCNPAAYTPKELWNRASKNLKFLVVQDLFLTETAKEADVVLPTLSFYEKEGSFISIEGRVQKLRPGKFIPQNIYSDEEIFTLLAQKMHIPLSIHPLFLEALQKPFIPLDRDAITTEPPFTAAETKEEGLKATFAKYLFDHDELMLHDPHLIQLAKEPRVRIHPSEGKKRGIDNGDLVRLRRGEKTIAAQVALDDKVALQTLVLPLVFPKVPVWELGADLLNGFAIEIQRDS
jgi:NADH-quinone oxidoreductase subunit G